MVSNGWHFAIPRVYQSTGHTDSNGPSNIKNARAGGMSYVDGYIFPCSTCGTSGASQVSATVSYLKNNGLEFVYNANVTADSDLFGEWRETETNGANFGMLWLDIEGAGSYWGSSTSTNVNFIQSMVDECSALGVSCGIYTSSSQWSPITGNTSKFSSKPLWYAHWDGKQTFSDFSAFGGWSSPSIKQYVGDTTLCSAGVDKNFY